MSGAHRSYDALLADVESGLGSGSISVGDQLPGERVLAGKYGISRASVREAVRILDVLGILDVPANAGPRSGPVVISNPSRGVGSALRLHVAARGLSVADIVETRILLETWAARAAGEHPSPGDLAEARTLLEAMDAPDLSPREFHGLDARFHVALSRLGGNVVIETLMEALGGSISGYIGDALAALDDPRAAMDELRSQHHAIFDAVNGRRQDTAAGLLRDHIHWLDDQTRGDVPETRGPGTR